MQLRYLIVLLGCNIFAVDQILVGQKAPDFSAHAAVINKEVEITLSQLPEGYKIIAFYPADFSFVCPTELRALQAKLPDFEKRHAIVLGISVDQVFTHLAWLKTPADKGGVKGITFPLVSDVTHAISQSYGVLSDKGTALRALFIVDTHNIIQAALINNGPVGRNIDEALRLLEAFQEVEENGEACPVSWHKGEKTIKPTPEGGEEYFKQLAEKEKKK